MLWQLYGLKGFRGKLPVDVMKVIEIFTRFCNLAADAAYVLNEIDVKPLIRTASGVYAVDVRFVANSHP